jgi:flagellar biosynthesis chaperone FliJ
MTDKLHKFAEDNCDLVKDSQVSGSRYYHFNQGKFILRISDHIGKTSDGNVSFIIDPNGYLLHNHTTDHISILPYKKACKIIKALATLSEVNASMNISSNKEFNDLKSKYGNVEQQLKDLKSKYGNVEQQLKTIKNELEDSRKACEKRQKEINDLKNQINHKNNLLKEMDDKLSNLRMTFLKNPIRTFFKIRKRMKDKDSNNI